MSKGTLQKLANQKNLLADLTIFAEAEQETFSEVQIITLNQHLNDLALDKSLNYYLAPSAYKGKIRPGAFNALVDMYATDLRETEFQQAKEFILITQDNIQIGVNKSMIDDNAIDYALSLLLQIETFNPGDKHEFGKRVKPCL